jgi:O-succinylhomoserine sulfhydrylase
LSDKNTPKNDPLAGCSAETLAVRAGLERSSFGENAEAIFLTSGFVYESAEAAEARFTGEQPGYVYSRYGNPTISVFERRLAAIEGAEACYGTGSGMSAIWTSLLACLRAGDHVVASRSLFGSNIVILQQFLPRFGVETTLIEGVDIAEWQNALRPNTKIFFIETPSNPQLGLLDIQAIADVAHAHGARLIVDNAFASPVVQRPGQFGADIIAYSATKHIDGQGRTLGGAVLASRDFLEKEFQPFLRHTGPALSPFNAWVLAKGLETLSLRVEKSSASALDIARLVEAHGAAKRTIYPFLESHPQYALARRQMASGGTVIAFDLGSKARAFAFMNALRIVDISNNLGDAKTLVTHPSTTTHRAVAAEDRLKAGITEGLVRISIGLEGKEDLARDIEQALDKAKGVQ